MDIHARDDLTLSGFNSTMVRLKDDEHELVSLEVAGFNSTMVRLKAKRCQTAQTIIDKFQFHNGSIKSKNDADDAEVADTVSIPQWFD